MRRPLLPFLLLAGACLPSEPASVFRELSLDEALRAAAAEKRPLLVDFHERGCVTCKVLADKVWQEPAVRAWLEAKTVPIRVDLAREPELGRRFGVEEHPTAVLLAASGEELERFARWFDAEKFLAGADIALAGRGPLALARVASENEPDDPGLRQKYGKELARHGQYDAALREFVWCFDEGAAHAKKYAAHRTTSLLTEFADLAGRHPPARAALVERSDRARSALLDGTPGRQDARDLASIARALDDRASVLAVYDALKAQGKLAPHVKQELWNPLLDALIDAKRYEEAADGAGDLEQRVQAALERFDRLKAPATAGEDTAKVRDDLVRGRCVAEAGRFVRIALGMQQDELARALIDRILAFDASAGTFEALVEEARLAGSPAGVEGLVQRARSTLTPEEAAKVEAQAAKPR